MITRMKTEEVSKSDWFRRESPKLTTIENSPQLVTPRLKTSENITPGEMSIGMPSNERALLATTQTLVANGKCLLAMDESNPTRNKRFAAHGIPQTEEMRRACREMIVTTPHLGDDISGEILYDETIRQTTADGRSFELVLAEAGIIPGIKVDMGAKDLAGHPGEKITEGLDGLRERLAEYLKMGARFAKWCAVFAIGDHVPSRSCIKANAHGLARSAVLCQEVGLVPSWSVKS